MKQLLSLPIGPQGSAALAIDAGKLRLSGGYGSPSEPGFDATLSVGYPVADLLDPVKKNFVDKLKALIPGTWDDVLIDKAWLEAVALISEIPAAPAV
jgi:hypothetical protein